jgi:putative mRNA 3-end processing factor
LYDALEYSCPHVDSLPQFGHTDECLESGTITIAGPEIPRERSSGRLFGVLKEDPNACVIQLIGSGKSPLTDGQCTIHSHTLSNHPSRATLSDIHDGLDPISTVVTHTSHGAKGAFNHLDSVVWGAGDTTEYVLYDEGQWLLPPWMAGETINRTGTQRLQQFAGNEILSSFSVPSLARHTTPDLAAEGVEEDRLAAMLHQRQSKSPTQQRTTTAEETTSDVSTSTPPQMTNNNADTADADASKSNSAELVQTVGPDIGDEPDPWLQKALNEGDLTEAEVQEALQTREDAVAKTQEQPSAESATSSDAADTETSPPPDADDSNTETVENQDKPASTVASAESQQSDGTDESEDTTAPSQTASETEGTTANDGAASATEANEDTDDDRTMSEQEMEDSPPMQTLQLSPVAISLAARMQSDDEAVQQSLTTIITEAIDSYVAALLAGEAAGDDDEQFAIEFEGSPAATDALSTVTKAEESLSEVVEDGIAAMIAEETAGRETVDIRERHGDHLDAIVRNDAYAFNSRESVAEAAIAWYVSAETVS